MNNLLIIAIVIIIIIIIFAIISIFSQVLNPFKSIEDFSKSITQGINNFSNWLMGSPKEVISVVLPYDSPFDANGYLHSTYNGIEIYRDSNNIFWFKRPNGNWQSSLGLLFTQMFIKSLYGF